MICHLVLFENYMRGREICQEVRGMHGKDFSGKSVWGKILYKKNVYYYGEIIYFSIAIYCQ